MMQSHQLDPVIPRSSDEGTAPANFQLSIHFQDDVPGTAGKFAAATCLVATLTLGQVIPWNIADGSHTAPSSLVVDINGDDSPATVPTVTSEVLNPLSRMVKAAFISAKREVFESGIQSNFGQFIKRVVGLYGESALTMVNKRLEEGNLSEDVLIEAIRSLGELHDPPTKMARFTLILRFLDHKSPIVRDSAALAFADLGDKGAISYLRAAATREKFSSIRSAFLNVAEELKEA